MIAAYVRKSERRERSEQRDSHIIRLSACQTWIFVNFSLCYNVRNGGKSAREGIMKMRERERNEIPKALGGGLETDADSAAPACGEGPAGGARGDARHPVERVYGILGKPGSTDEYLAEIRGR